MGPRASGSSATRAPRDLHWWAQRAIVAACGLLAGMLFARIVGF